MSRTYSRLACPPTCATCSVPVTFERKQARYRARQRGFAYCGSCGAAARAANISATKPRPRP